ncbi:MAG: hypothetical protein LBF61_12780 [Azoarcus sp.]|nr:hypothetical protein [Azoarcus sp.]
MNLPALRGADEDEKANESIQIANVSGKQINGMTGLFHADAKRPKEDEVVKQDSKRNQGKNPAVKSEQ